MDHISPIIARNVSYITPIGYYDSYDCRIVNDCVGARHIGNVYDPERSNLTHRAISHIVCGYTTEPFPNCVSWNLII